MARRSPTVNVRATVLVAALAAISSTLLGAEPTALTFFAYKHNVKGHIVGQRAVACLALRSEGAISLGKTDDQGELTVPHSELLRPDTFALLFCQSDGDVNCSAIRLDLPGLGGFAEYNVQSPAPKIIDRMKVAAPTNKPRG